MFTRTIQGRSYYAYSFHHTYERASESLEQDFADGTICEAEHPPIVSTTDRKLRGSKAQWAVMFPM